jgi:hypothetical protein
VRDRFRDEVLVLFAKRNVLREHQVVWLETLTKDRLASDDDDLIILCDH